MWAIYIYICNLPNKALYILYSSLWLGRKQFDTLFFERKIDHWKNHHKFKNAFNSRGKKEQSKVKNVILIRKHQKNSSIFFKIENVENNANSEKCSVLKGSKHLDSTLQKDLELQQQ